MTGWNARRHATAASLLVLCAAPFPVLSGQAVSVLPGAAVALVSQDGPLGGQSGVGGGLGLTAAVRRWIGFTAAVEIASFRKGDEIGLCIIIAPGECLRRPATELIVAGSVAVELQAALGAALRPFVAVGPAVLHSLGPPNPGERRTWVTPQAEGGLRVATTMGQWALSVRWRRVDRWQPQLARSELGLLLGFRRAVSR